MNGVLKNIALALFKFVDADGMSIAIAPHFFRNDVVFGGVLLIAISDLFKSVSALLDYLRMSIPFRRLLINKKLIF